MSKSPPALALPKWSQMRTDVMPPIDLQLLERARAVRLCAGITAEAFARFNIAVMRVRVGFNGPVEYLTACNEPYHEGGIHSEEFLRAQLFDARRTGRDLRPDMLYTERIPCNMVCRELVRLNWPSAGVYYSVNERDESLSRGTTLMKRYGLG